VHGKQPCDLHEKARDQAHQQQNSGKNNQRISIASRMITGANQILTNVSDSVIRLRQKIKKRRCRLFVLFCLMGILYHSSSDFSSRRQWPFL
jgi:hypothetical protein